MSRVGNPAHHAMTSHLGSTSTSSLLVVPQQINAPGDKAQSRLSMPEQRPEPSLETFFQPPRHGGPPWVKRDTTTELSHISLPMAPIKNEPSGIHMGFTQTLAPHIGISGDAPALSPSITHKPRTTESRGLSYPNHPSIRAEDSGIPCTTGMSSNPSSSAHHHTFLSEASLPKEDASLKIQTERTTMRMPLITAATTTNTPHGSTVRRPMGSISQQHQPDSTHPGAIAGDSSHQDTTRGGPRGSHHSNTLFAPDESVVSNAMLPTPTRSPLYHPAWFLSRGVSETTTQPVFGIHTSRTEGLSQRQVPAFVGVSDHNTPHLLGAMAPRGATDDRKPTKAISGQSWTTPANPLAPAEEHHGPSGLFPARLRDGWWRPGGEGPHHWSSHSMRVVGTRSDDCQAGQRIFST